MTDLIARYSAMQDDPDPLRAAVGRALLQRVQGSRPRTQHASEMPPSRFRFVPLADLFQKAGNPVTGHGRKLVCGHQPFHGSSSGTCVAITPETGRWYCFSCRQFGDAASLVMALRGWDYRTAARWLRAEYGKAA